MPTVRNIIPPHLTVDAEWEDENGRFLGFADALEYIYRVETTAGETHDPITKEAKRLLYFRISEFLSESDPDHRKLLTTVRDNLARSFAVKAYDQARTDVVDDDTGARLPGYTENEVFTIKKNILSDFLHVASTIGTPFAIAQVLRHFLFTNVDVDKTGYIDARHDGAFNRNGFIVYDGGSYFANALFTVTATKPASLTDGQAKHIARAIADGYKPEHLRVYRIVLV